MCLIFRATHPFNGRSSALNFFGITHFLSQSHKKAPRFLKLTILGALLNCQDFHFDLRINFMVPIRTFRIQFESIP